MSDKQVLRAVMRRQKSDGGGCDDDSTDGKQVEKQDEGRQAKDAGEDLPHTFLKISICPSRLPLSGNLSSLEAAGATVRIISRWRRIESGRF